MNFYRKIIKLNRGIRKRVWLRIYGYSIFRDDEKYPNIIRFNARILITNVRKGATNRQQFRHLAEPARVNTVTCNYAREEGGQIIHSKLGRAQFSVCWAVIIQGKGYRVTFNLRLILSLILSYNNVVPQGFRPPRHLDTIASLTIRSWLQTYPPITFARQDPYLDGVRARISNRGSLLERHLCYVTRSRL